MTKYIYTEKEILALMMLCAAQGITFLILDKYKYNSVEEQQKAIEKEIKKLCNEFLTVKRERNEIIEENEHF